MKFEQLQRDSPIFLYCQIKEHGKCIQLISEMDLVKRFKAPILHMILI